MTTETTPFAISIALNAEGQAPDWIELIPAGPQVAGRDGRTWTMESPVVLAAAFNSERQPVPLDWEHSTQIKAAKGEPAPAAGWIEELEARNGAIWGRVSWTEAGRESVASRAYRFVSPAFSFDRERRIRRLVHAGLTNQPNLRLAALNHETPDSEDQDSMSLKPITDALDLDDGASQTQIVTAINRLKSEHQTALNSAAKPDPEKYIPKAEHELALNKIETLEAADKKRADAEIEATVDALIKAGDPNHPPAKRDDYIAICREEGGLERFKRLFKADLDKALNRVETADKPAPGKADSSLTPDEKIAANQLGYTDEEFLAAKKDDD